MSKAANQANENRKLKETIHSLELELSRLRPIVANVSPSALFKSKKTEPKEVTPQMLDRIIALGIAGFPPAEIRAELQIKKEKHNEWVKSISEYKSAFARARDLASVYYMRRFRIGIETNDFKFNYDRAVKMIDYIINSDFEGGNRGDASTLITLNTGQCDCKQAKKVL